MYFYFYHDNTLDSSISSAQEIESELLAEYNKLTKNSGSDLTLLADVIRYTIILRSVGEDFVKDVSTMFFTYGSVVLIGLVLHRGIIYLLLDK